MQRDAWRALGGGVERQDSQQCGKHCDAKLAVSHADIVVNCGGSSSERCVGMGARCVLG
jgi:hypothetical protein